MFVGYDDRGGEPVVPGSGFLVGTQPELIALTATHIFSEWAAKVRPAPRHALSDAEADGQILRDRLYELVNKNLIRAVVHCRPPGQYTNTGCAKSPLLP
jgi:hypothetical protein